MTATLTPQTPEFKRTVADLYGDRESAATPALAPTLPADPIRTAYRAAVEQVAANAKAALPDSSGRIDSAVKLVLSGDVAIQPDGSARVASQSRGKTTYLTVNGSCECRDVAQAPHGQCKHRIARGIATRAYALASAMLDAPATSDDQPEPAAVEQPVPDVTPDLAAFTVLVHGRPFVRYAGLLLLAHARGLHTIEARFVSVSATLAVAEATATFTDGRRFTEASDATPDNVGPQVKAHFARLALTRAKARALKDALGVDLCSVEELD